MNNPLVSIHQYTQTTYGWPLVLLIARRQPKLLVHKWGFSKDEYKYLNSIYFDTLCELQQVHYSERTLLHKKHWLEQKEMQVYTI